MGCVRGRIWSTTCFHCKLNGMGSSLTFIFSVFLSPHPQLVLGARELVLGHRPSLFYIGCEFLNSRASILLSLISGFSETTLFWESLHQHVVRRHYLAQVDSQGSPAPSPY